MPFMTAAPAGATPSPRRAFFMSLVAPGWGQRALAHPRRAIAFAGIEGAGWLSFGGVRAMKGIYEDDYRGLAASRAGANVRKKTRTYFSDLAFYDTRELHNQAALVYDQPDPVLYGPDDDWQWPTTADRLRYRARLNDARIMDRRTDYVVLALVINHVAAAIDAAKLAAIERSEGRDVRSESSRPVPSHSSLLFSHSSEAMTIHAEPLLDGGRIVCSLRF